MNDLTPSNRRLVHLAGVLAGSALAAYGLHQLWNKQNSGGDDTYPVDLGTYSLKHQTTSKTCQRWCDRAWAWVAGFHRQEASDCFLEAIRADPQCAMAHYGLALVNGPDYNFTAEGGFYTLASQPSNWPSLNVAVNALKRAEEITREPSWSGPPQHRALIKAMFSTRYEWPVTPTTADKQVAYRDAMRTVAVTYPNDPEVQAIYAESVMCLSAWDLYDNQTTNPTPNEYGRECAIALDRGLMVAPSHLWLCHLKVHYNEMGPVDQFDWSAAEALRSPGHRHEIGHLLHMPTHLDIQAGEYEKAMRWNKLAYQADLKVIRAFPDKNLVIYTGYLVHNMEFAAWAAMYGGSYENAMEAANEIDQIVTEKLLMKSERTAQRMELYRATRLMILIRFGKWRELIAMTFQQDRELHLAHTLFLHYGRGIAYGALGDVASAKQEQRAFLGMTATLKPDDRIKHNVHICDMANIAKNVLNAEILYREEHFEDAFAALRSAVESFDGLPYDEPHGWLMSPRHTLGALLTEQKKFYEALEVYEQDLIKFPKNPWSLSGAQTCFDGLGLGRKDDSARNRTMLEFAMKACDVRIGASCACALEDWGESGTKGEECCAKSTA